MVGASPPWGRTPAEVRISRRAARSRFLRHALGILACGALLVMLPGELRLRLSRDWGAQAEAAADAKPLFLTTRAVARGEDPTDPAVLRTLAGYHPVYRRAPTIAGPEPTGKGSPFASMYPPTLPTLLAAVAPEQWWDFAGWWRHLGMVLFLGGGAAAGAAARRAQGRLAGTLIGLAVALWCTPAVEVAVQLGQANLHLAGVLGLLLLALSLGWSAVGGALLALGAAVKLAPLALVGALGLGRRWGALAAGAVTGGGLLLWSGDQIGVGAVIADVWASVRYAGALTPPWLADGAPVPLWLWKLWALRTVHLGLATAAIALVALWGAPGDDRRLAGVGALVCAWVALVAAPGGVVYGPLLLPAMAWLAASAVEGRRPLLSLLPLLVAAPVVHGLCAGGPAGPLGPLPPAGALLVAAAVLWWAVALRVVIAAMPRSGPVWRAGALGLGLGSSVAVVGWMVA